MPRLKTKQLSTLLGAFLFFMSFTASAHEIRPAIVDINLSKDGNYTMAIQLNLEALIANIGTQHKDTNESDQAHIYDGLRQMPYNELIEEFADFEPTLLPNIQLKFNQKTQNLNVESVEIPDVGDIDLARDSVIHFSGKVPSDAKELSWQWHKNYGNAVLKVSTDKKPELYSSYLLDGKTSDTIKIEGATARSTWDQFINYIQVGYVHIVPKGLDHILFVVGLFLLSTQLRPLLIQITSFTLAHSVTLALSIYGIISVPSSIVEPLIAASIIYVCIENIFAEKLSRWRPLIIFLFGLLHGLGFASVLKEIGLASDNFATSLIAFNVGVELGQLSVIAACFLLVGIWFRDKPWYRQRITIPASVLIAIIASFWLVERTVLA